MSLRPSTRAELRKKSYKMGVDMENARRRREDNLLEIRKSKREGNLLKKRREVCSWSPLVPSSQARSAMEKQLESLPGMVQGVWSEDPVHQLEATTQFSRLLSFECPPIKEVIIAGVVPRFVEFLSRHDLPQLQLVSAWVLTSVTSETSEYTRVVTEHGAIPKLVRLLSSPNDKIREQAVWALGNIAGASPVCRDLVLSHGALIPLLYLLNERSKKSMLRIGTWTLHNLCRNNPPAPFGQMKPALQILQPLIHLTDEEVMTNACWAISCLSDGPGEQIQAVIETGVCPRIAELLLHPSPEVLIPAVRIVGSIVSGNDAQTQCMIDNHVLPCLYKLLTGTYKVGLKKEACWAISNITAGNKAQIQAVFDAGIICPLLHLLQHAESTIKIEVAWVITNAIKGGSNEQIHYLVREGCIKPMCDLLACGNPKFVFVCLEGLENILRVGEVEKDLGKTGGLNVYARLIDECEGLDKIERLQGHNNDDIYAKAMSILERYWDAEDEEGEDVHGSGGEYTSQFGVCQPDPLYDFKFG